MISLLAPKALYSSHLFVPTMSWTLIIRLSIDIAIIEIYV